MTDEPATHLDRALAQAAQRWPTVVVSRERFATFIAEHAGKGGELAADLVLVCACLDHQPAALVLFETQLLGPITARLARSGFGTGTAEEAAGRLRESLLVGIDGGAPRLASYSGRGGLRGWLEVVATREAYKLARHDAGTNDDQILASIPDDDDLEVRQIKSQHQAELGKAFATALAALPRRDRLVLRQRYLDGLTFDQVATLNSVHRITVMKRLARIEKSLLGEIRRLLTERLRLKQSEVEKLVADARSKLDLSLGGLLRSKVGLE